MKALVYVAIGKKALQDHPKPEIQFPTDAIVRVTKTTICGTDLHILKGDVATCTPGRVLGHEGVGVIECVGTEESLATAIGAVRDGGVVSRLGVSQYTQVPMGFDTMMRNLTLTGGAAPARAYIDELMPDILDGTVEPGRVFDRTIGLDGVPDGYRAMADRDALKVLIKP